MKNLLLLLSLLSAALLSSTRAYADSVVQYNGKPICSGRNSLDTLIVGKDIPADAAWAPFTPYQKDDDINHYDIRGGVLYYTKLNLAAPYTVVAKTETELQNAARTADDATFLKLLRVKFMGNPTQEELDAAKGK